MGIAIKEKRHSRLSPEGKKTKSAKEFIDFLFFITQLGRDCFLSLSHTDVFMCAVFDYVDILLKIISYIFHLGVYILGTFGAIDTSWATDFIYKDVNKRD